MTASAAASWTCGEHRRRSRRGPGHPLVLGHPAGFLEEVALELGHEPGEGCGSVEGRLGAGEAGYLPGQPRTPRSLRSGCVASEAPLLQSCVAGSPWCPWACGRATVPASVVTWPLPYACDQIPLLTGTPAVGLQAPLLQCNHILANNVCGDPTSKSGPIPRFRVGVNLGDTVAPTTGRYSNSTLSSPWRCGCPDLPQGPEEEIGPGPPVTEADARPQGAGSPARPGCRAAPSGAGPSQRGACSVGGARLLGGPSPCLSLSLSGICSLLVFGDYERCQFLIHVSLKLALEGPGLTPKL